MKRDPLCSRRRFLAGLGGLAFAPLSFAMRASGRLDVVVVGAGAAGLAAGRFLLERGKSIVILEARDRIGGRAHTETTTFGVPYDRGCHWLQGAYPWVDYGRANGFDVYPDPDGTWPPRALYIGGRPANASERSAYEKAYRSLYDVIAQSGQAGKDVSPASVFDTEAPFHQLAANMIGPWTMGKDLEHFSCTDWWSHAGGDDWYCREGFGALVEHYGRGLPIHLSTAVTGIRWNGRGVRVDTNTGTLEADAVISRSRQGCWPRA